MIVVVPLILLAAVAHASWNAIAKSVPDRVAATTWIGGCYLVVGAVALALLPLPAAPSWPFVLASSLAQAVYLLLLVSAYRVGDFGATYPLARGMSPLVVSVVSVTALGETLSPLGVAGVAAVCGGLGWLAFARRGTTSWRAVALAVAAGLVIAGYTLLDGVGVRRSGDPFSYAAWLFALQGAVIVLGALVLRRRRLTAVLRPYWRQGVAGGVLSLLSYGIVVWAQDRTPLATVATLREVSVVLAAFVGRVVFKERLGPARIGAVVLVAAGITVIAATA